jgi:exodeoxyribonuclease V beta subunit
LQHGRAAARARALAGYRRELLRQREQRLRSRGQLVFDSLLSRVHAALHAAGSPLPALLRQAWPVAMVDEFQDTDGQQFGILDRIYRDGDGGPGGRLVMIGDPKQAIYRFRGGDIHAYETARQGAGDHLRLQVNFRSSRRYLEALNTLFAAAGPVLGQDPAGAIRVDPVLPGPEADAEPFRHGDLACTQPLVVHLEPSPPAAQPDRCEAALLACANQVVRMLGDPELRIGDRRLRPGDFAVLVPSNQQVARMRSLLQARRVPCVGAGRSSVFATDCARELQVLLFGIEHTGDPGAVRAALATRLYGLDFAAVRALDDDLPAWQQHHQRLLRWREEWQRGGVLGLLRALLVHAAARLRASADAERLLTDLRHLGELLQDAGEHLGGRAALLDWLQRQREGDEGTADAEVEEQQLRIESDARRVRLMTLHAAKGLEFPLVMLPLMWAHEGRDCPLPLWRDGAGRRWLDLGSDEVEAVRRREQHDDQDERFRVLYVALTRARHGCHLFALPHDRAQNGASRQPPSDPRRSALDALLERIGPLGESPAGAPGAPIAWQVGDWQGGLECHRPEPDDAPAVLAARAEPPGVPYRQRYSFSALAQGHAPGLREEQAADDEPVSGPGPADADGEGAVDAGLLALAGWRGIDFGNAVHAMFERREPGRRLGDQLPLVRGCLGTVLRAGEDVDAASAAIAARLDAVLQAELLPGLRLAALAPAAMRAEMEFHFALGEVSMRELREACAAHGQPGLVPASTRVLRGYMTGKIDLVLQHDGRFHVLDYKGNWLGDRIAEYQGEALARAMDAHHYRFQALLYSVALARYLRQRLPGCGADALGEAIYVFVRAAGLTPDAGIWRGRFEPGLLAAVDAVLAGEAQVAA